MFNKTKAIYHLIAFVVIAIVVNGTLATSGCVIGVLVSIITPEQCTGKSILEAFGLAVAVVLAYAAGQSSIK